ncbi:MAG TPA: lytic transglycosylase domain-containing protein [Bacillota bacterium]|nr:lytic transglycosylase domain-containing protein [Bacillota bacterium]
MILNRYISTMILGIVFLGLALPFAFTSEPEPEPSLRPVPFYELIPKLRNQMILETIHQYNPKLDIFQRNRICTAITTQASRYNFDPFFISSVIAAESSFSLRAVSSRSAMGLMQLTHPVIEIMGIHNPFDIEENIKGGIRYLNDLRSIFPRLELVLAAYNAGPGRVSRVQRIPDIPETINYVAKVNSFYLILQNQFRYLVQHTIVNSVSFAIAFQEILPHLPTTYFNQTSPILPTPIFENPLVNLYEPRKKPLLAKRVTLQPEKKSFEFTSPNYSLNPFIG